MMKNKIKLSKSAVKKILIGITIALIVLTIGFSAVFLYFYHRMNIKSSYTPKVNNEMISTKNIELIDHTNTDDVICEDYCIKPIDYDFIQLKEDVSYIENILLIGQDSRSEKNVGLSDTMIILTINKKTNEIKLTSLMRDIYVDIPDKGGQKLNAALPIGGTDLLFKTIKKNFNIDLDTYVVVDFAGFKKIINAIGGVEIDVNKTDYDYLKTTNYIDNLDSRKALKLGKQTLDGSQALGYSRIRKVGNNDFERTERQREVIIAAFDKIKKLGSTELLKLVDTGLPYITTNLDINDIMGFIPMLTDFKNTKVEQLRIPTDDAFSFETINKASVVLIDFEKNIKELYRFIYGVDIDDTNDSTLASLSSNENTSKIKNAKN